MEWLYGVVGPAEPPKARTLEDAKDDSLDDVMRDAWRETVEEKKEEPRPRKKSQSNPPSHRPSTGAPQRASKHKRKSKESAFVLPTRLAANTPSRQEWRKAQWSDLFGDELNVAKRLPLEDREAVYDFHETVHAYVHRFGAVQFGEIRDRGGRSILWHAVDLGDRNAAEILLEYGCAKDHDPVQEYHSPWVLARRLDEPELFDMLSGYLASDLNDDAVEKILAQDDANLARAKRRKSAHGFVSAFVGDVFAAITCGQLTCGMDDAGEEWDGGRRPRDHDAELEGALHL